MTYKRWDVVAVNYPFLEGTDTKRRPALVVSAPSLLDEHGLCWLVMITTAKAGTRQGDIPVSNTTSAGLPEDCVVRVPRLTAMMASVIDRRLGALSMKERTAVQAQIRKFCP